MRESWQNSKQIWILIFVLAVQLVAVGCSSGRPNADGSIADGSIADNANTTAQSSTEADGSTETNPSAMSEGVVPNMENITNEHLARVLNFMGPSSTGIVLTEAALIAPVDEIGALEGAGFLAQDPEVRFSVYAFESQAEHQAAFDMLVASIPSENVEKLLGSNGPVLFIGYTVTDGTNGDPLDAEMRLSTLGGAFAGEE